MEQGSGLRVVAASSPALAPTVEAAVRAGLPLLVEDLGESIDPLLEPLLSQATYKKGARLLAACTGQWRSQAGARLCREPRAGCCLAQPPTHFTDRAAHAHPAGRGRGGLRPHIQARPLGGGWLFPSFPGGRACSARPSSCDHLHPHRLPSLAHPPTHPGCTWPRGSPTPTTCRRPVSR
jgi:hypothetical protein